MSDGGVRRVYVLVNNRPQIAGRRMVLSPRTFRTWESILRYMSSTLGIAVRTLYDLQSETEIDRYAGLAGLEDGSRYVAVAAGDKFRPNVEYLYPDGPVKPPANGDEIIARKNSVGAHIPSVVRKLGLNDARGATGRVFNQHSKGLHVNFFVNGDDLNLPVQVVLNVRNCQSFQHLLETATKSLQSASYIRRLYDASTSLRIQTLKELHDGMSLVGVAQGPFKIVQYHIPENSAPQEEEDSDVNEVRVCIFLPNGVPFHNGTRATVSRGRFEDINKLLAHLTAHLRLSFGRPRRIYALPNGRRITSISALLACGSTHFSVAAADEPFIDCEYLDSRELKPPTASGSAAVPWIEEEDRSQSAPAGLQRGKAAVAAQPRLAQPAPEAKIKMPAKPVKSFMETLEMSKKLLERQREMQPGVQPMPILSASKPPVIADEEPSESQLDMFIRANKKDSRKRVSFGDDARDGDEVRQTSDVQHEHADFPATEELDHETQESMDSEF